MIAIMSAAVCCLLISAGWYFMAYQPAIRDKAAYAALIQKMKDDDAARIAAENKAKADEEAKLSALLAFHEARSCDLFVPDEGIRRDMDTPEELAGIRELAIHREIPSLRECEAILAERRTDMRAVRHSRVVAQVAYRITAALANGGVPVEPLLARAGGLLHDLAKGEPSHATAGAQILRDLELGEVADVVALHTDYQFTEERLDEAAIVYLADKLVSGEKVVTLAERFHGSLERFRENPIALAAASQRRAAAEAIAHEVESRLGVELHSVIGDSLDAENIAGKARDR